LSIDQFIFGIDIADPEPPNAGVLTKVAFPPASENAVTNCDVSCGPKKWSFSADTQSSGIRDVLPYSANAETAARHPAEARLLPG
jgi:hypothetical protein